MAMWVGGAPSPVENVSMMRATSNCTSRATPKPSDGPLELEPSDALDESDAMYPARRIRRL
jgi:hypothetical protein